MSLLIIDFNLLIFFVVAARGSFRVLHARKNRLLGRNVLIYGVGKTGAYAVREFLNNPKLDLRPVGFIDDDSRNKGKVVNGYPVIGTLESLENILKKNSISEVILAISEFPKEKLERLSQICSSYRIPLRFQTRLEDIPT